MDDIKKIAKSAQAHVIRCRGRYAALATLAVCAAINNARVKEMNGFLEDHNLLDEYYTPEIED
jgi:hypothetical protein